MQRSRPRLVIGVGDKLLPKQTFQNRPRWQRGDGITPPNFTLDTYCVSGLVLKMIRLFKGKDTQRTWQGQSSWKLPGDIQDRALRKLRQLDAAAILEDLRNPPGNRLEALKGTRIGHTSVRINDQWRIYFRWVDHDA
jgi:proteic killer suppression protein